MSQAIDSLWGSFDAGHYGPGVAWSVYSALLVWEAFRICFVLRRRFVEPLFAVLGGLAMAAIHLFVLHDCLRLPADDSKQWNQARCFSVNGVHFGFGVYALVMGLFDAVQHARCWQRAVAGQPRQYHFLPPSLFFAIGLIMVSHEQDSPWQEAIHQQVGLFAMVFFLLRACSYSVPGLLAPAGLVGIVGGVLLANSSSNAHIYWTQTAGGSNMFGIVVSVPVLLLAAAAATLIAVIVTMIAVWLCATYIPADSRLRRVGLPARLDAFFEPHFLDPTTSDTAAASQSPYDVIDAHQLDDDKVDNGAAALN